MVKKWYILIIILAIFSFVSSAQITGKIDATIENFKIFVNGVEKTYENPIVTINDRTYLPLREVAETLGINIEWNEAQQKVEISTDKNTQEEILYVFEQNDLYGYMNKLGKIIIEPQFNDAEDFYDGLAVVGKAFDNLPEYRDVDTEWFAKIPGKVLLYGYINTKGELVIPYSFEKAKGFNSDRAVVYPPQAGNTYNPDSRHTKYIIDREGHKLFDLSYRINWDYSEGFMAANIGSEKAYDKDGDYFIGLWSYIDKNGNLATQNTYYEYASSFSDGLAVVKNKAGKCGVINKNFETVIDFKFDHIVSFHNGYAAAEIDNIRGVINSKGEVIIDFQYINIGSYSNGLIYASKDGNYGYIDINNNTVIPFKFKYAEDFKNGLAAVKDTNDKYGIINTKGEYVIKPSYSKLEICQGGLIKVNSDNNGFYYVNENGNYVLPN